MQLRLSCELYNFILFNYLVFSMLFRIKGICFFNIRKYQGKIKNNANFFLFVLAVLQGRHAYTEKNVIVYGPGQIYKFLDKSGKEGHGLNDFLYKEDIHFWYTCVMTVVQSNIKV